MARFGSIPTQLDIPAGNFVRRNAGDTAFEAAGDVIIDADFSSQGICLRGATPGVYSIMGGSSAIDTVEASLTDDATHMPTSAAVYAAIATASMVYPDAGIALSTGTAWGTSIVNNSANWNTAYGWGDHSGLYANLSHVHGNISNVGAIGTTTNLPIITTTAGVLTVGSFGTTSATFCEGDDSRLSDDRDPNAHILVSADHTASGLTAGHFLKATGTTTFGFAVHGLTYSDVGAAATSHTHGNITNAGAIGSTTNLPIITTTAGVLIASSFGTTSTTFCEGNDSRLSDARTPTAHAASHEVSGGDLVSHDGLTDFVAGEHFLQSAITAVATSVGDGIMTVQTGTLGVLGGSSAIDTVEAALTDDATHMPTSAAVYAAIVATAMVYPDAGIALSTGSAWGTSIVNNSANWNTAYSHSQLITGNPHVVTYAQLGGSQPAPIAHMTTHLSTGGDTIPLFSPTSVISGLVPGSDSVGATYYLNATGNWTVPTDTVPIDNILDWNGTAYAPYAAQSTGNFDSGAVNPISAVNRLNYDGEFYAYNLYAVNDATVTGQLGVGEVPISTFAGTFKGASTDDDWSNTIVAYDNRVLAAGTGGGITFGGIYTDIGGYTVGGFIRIEKEDAVTDQYGYDLLIGNRVDNASSTSLIDLKAAGGIEFYFYPYPTARSKKFEVTADGVKATLPQVDQNYAVLSDVDGNLTRTLVSGSPTTDFLRGDGTWATPAGSGAGNPAGSDHHVQFNDAGSFGGNAGFQWVDNAWVNINSGTRDTGERLHVYNATNYTYSQLIRTGSPYAHGLWIKQHGASNSTYAFAIQRNVDTTAQYLFGVVLDGRTFLRGYTTATYALAVQQYHATGHGLQIDMTEYTSGAYYAIQVQESTDTAKFTLTGAGDMWTAGDVGIGGTNATAKLYAYHNVSGAYVAYFNQAHATGHGIRVDIDAASGTTYTLFKGYRDSTKIAELRSDGDWWAHDFLHDSDKRLKDVYQTVNDGLESVLKLNPVTYRWKDKQDDYIHTGFIAQEVQKVFPELVKEGDDGLLSLSYNKVTAINTAAIQGLNRKVDTIEDKLRKEIVDLKLRVKELENG